MEEADAASSSEQNIDWSQLNHDLVYLISKKITDLSDFVRFRAVCKRWRSAVPRSDPSARFPWIYQHRNSLLEDFDFYSLPYARIITFESSDKEIGTAASVGSSVRYLLSLARFREDWISMGRAPLNPPSRSLIPVPPPRDWGRLYMMKPCDMYLVEKWGECSFLFENIVYENKYKFDLCSDDWIFKKEHHQGTGNAYHKGMYFEDSPSEGTTVIDIYSGEILFKIPPQERVNPHPVVTSQDEELPKGMHCLVETSSEELLKIYRPYDIKMDFKETFFEVYRLCMDAEQAFWIEVKDMGDEILFLDYSAMGLALNACDFSGCEGNCIYFLKGQILEVGESPSFILCWYNLVDGKVEKLPYPSEKWGTWVIPFLG